MLVRGRGKWAAHAKSAQWTEQISCIMVINSKLACGFPVPCKVKVEHGSEVRLGDDLVIIEAMKMRNAVKASREGFVDEVYVKQGDVVAADQRLLRFW